MQRLLVLCPLLALLAACSTPDDSALRRGRVIKAAEPAPAPARPAVPAPAPVAPPPPPPAPAPVVTAPPPPAVPAAPEPAVAVVPAPIEAPKPDEAAPLATARGGATVKLAWLLPVSDVGYKAIEIMRNDRAEAPGRARVRAVRATVTSLEDTVPDAAADYWYWLKLTREDGQIRNIGPVAAPAKP